LFWLGASKRCGPYSYKTQTLNENDVYGVEPVSTCGHRFVIIKPVLCYKSACAGYDYYEKGVLVSKNCAESEMPFAYDGESEKTYGKICSYINDDDVVINILVGNSTVEETDTLGHKSPLSNEDQTASDMESYAESSLLEPTAIERNKKMYIRAELCDNDDDLKTSDIATLMSDKKMLSDSDKCFAFYVIFK